jgi:peptidoglycan/LPS O-acetylase OafA/YrhL
MKNALVESEHWRVQSARGLACVLLVAYHVVGNDVTNGLRVEQDSGWRILTLLFEHLRMPLFAFLSGYVYAYRPALPGHALTFSIKKVKRLLIPLLVVTTIFFPIQNLTPGANAHLQDWTQMWRIYVFPYAHFWFLQSILLIFAFTLVADRWMKNIWSYAVVLALVLAAHFLVKIEFDKNYFSIAGAFMLLPFFVLGIGVNRFPGVFRKPAMKGLSLVVLVLLWSIYAIECFRSPLDVPGKGTLFGTSLSIVSCLAVIYWLPTSRWLATLGAYSFSIYLYHVVFAAAARIALFAIGDTGLPSQFVIGLAAGIAGPITFELAIRNYPFARRAFLGQS